MTENTTQLKTPPKATVLPDYNTRFTEIGSLRNRARKKIPHFAFEYLDGGCNEEVNLRKNTDRIRELELKPFYLNRVDGINLKTTILGTEYNLPFGIAPIGLQGLIWPGSPEILAKAAFKHNIPFILSTVTSAGLEDIAKITEGQAWFQLYHPVQETLRDDLLKRAQESGYKTLVILADTPVFGFRHRDIRNGLAMPPSMTLKNILQIFLRPHWAWKTLCHGTPQFSTLLPYISPGSSLKQLGQFMNQTFDGRLNEEKLSRLREKWRGKLVIKGIVTEEDTEKVINIGYDGMIVSNHGGRQLDAGESTIAPLQKLVKKYGQKIEIMIDSGVRTGPDIGRCLAAGAKAVFLGRTFMYGVAALGKYGGEHSICVLKAQLNQLMEQLRCECIADLPKHLKSD